MTATPWQGGRSDARPCSSRAAAAENFHGRGAFECWVDGAFDSYIECGSIDDGDQVRLACRPEVEADIYRAWKAHDTWDRLGSIDVPVLVMAGEQSDTIMPSFARQQSEQFPRAGVEIVPETGHFLPMERLELAAERARRFVEATTAG